MNISEQRKQLRRQLRLQRNALTVSEQHKHSRLLARNLHHSRHFRQARHVAFYLAEDGELSAEKAIETAWKMGKKVYLPVLSPFADSLYFAPYTKKTRMVQNRFGIAEPFFKIRLCKKAHQLQIIYMPLVGFDLKGNRLGMGGGFYDRSLHFRQHQKSWRKPRLVGLGHECQRVDNVPTEAWDIPLDGMITEQRYYRF